MAMRFFGKRVFFVERGTLQVFATQSHTLYLPISPLSSTSLSHTLTSKPSSYYLDLRSYNHYEPLSPRSSVYHRIPHASAQHSKGNKLPLEPKVQTS